jgi:hypothetical protein
MRSELHLLLQADTRHQGEGLRVRRRGDGNGKAAGGEELAKHDP